ncbi:MAG: epoxyqueuosine reductase QueH [Candidatus Omnitrophica bacterium]|nr:epoxyqueuosine reductase QueH [Candidatus Omnitrophota bacterium]
MEKLIAPQGEKRVLLHCCCAPCSGSIIESMLFSQIRPTLFFYNPNIQPKTEYLNRKKEVVNYALKMNIDFVDADYDAFRWLKSVEDLSLEPEGGKRCEKCFDIRLDKTALHASENNFKVFATTLGISRWKNLDQITESGMRIATNYPDISYWDYNWRKDGGSQRMYELAKQESFYKQEYCGCAFSLRDVNNRRYQEKQSLVEIGKNRY